MPDATKISYMRFTLIFIGLSVAIGVIAYLAETYFRLTIPSSGLSVVAPMLAAMDAGQKYAHNTHEIPPSGMAWRVAGKMTVIVMVISIPLSILVLYGAFTEDESLTRGTLIPIFASVFLFLSLVFWVMNRVFFTMGASNQLKTIARKNMQ